jgi:hypothetical protein
LGSLQGQGNTKKSTDDMVDLGFVVEDIYSDNIFISCFLILKGGRISFPAFLPLPSRVKAGNEILLGHNEYFTFGYFFWVPYRVRAKPKKVPTTRLIYVLLLRIFFVMIFLFLAF